MNNLPYDSLRSFAAFCALALVLAGAAACGDDSPCTDGATTTCNCLIGGETLPGVQTCTSEVYGACDCDPMLDAGLLDGSLFDASLDAGSDMAVDACLCSEGATETRLSQNCGEDTRTCTGCAWSDWTETMAGQEEPECLQGEGKFARRASFERGGAAPDGWEICYEDEGRVRWHRCGQDCRWDDGNPYNPELECGGGCDGERRASPSDAEEICVPARHGGVRIGCDAPDQDCYPQHDVYVSAFYIDRFAVTVRRYQVCVAAGVCTPLEPFTVEMDPPPEPDEPIVTFDDLSFDDLDVNVWTATHMQAVTFCEFDGAQLISGAQWERAMLGRAEEAAYPWGGGDHASIPVADLLEPRTCEFLGPISPGSCPPRRYAIRPRVPFSFDAELLPHAFTAIGVQNMFWWLEWTSDTTTPYDRSLSTQLTDPEYPGSGPYERRGGLSQLGGMYGVDGAIRQAGVAYYRGVNDWPDQEHASFRCARAPEGAR